MKLILTENQYALLEAIINEATPMSTKIDDGGYIEVVYLLNDLEKSVIFQVVGQYGSGQYIEVVDSTSRYIINVGGSLNKESNTFTILRDAIYKDGEKTDDGKILAPEIIGGTKLILKNVTQVNISDSTKKVVDSILTSLGDKKSKISANNEKERELEKQRSNQRKAEKDTDAKLIAQMAYNDPDLRKLISYQPSILGGLIKLGKAKGLAHIDSLLTKHGINVKDKTLIKKEFLKGHVYSYEVMYPVRVTYGTDTINFFTGQNYKVRFDGERFNGHVGEGSDKVSYYIKTNKKSDDNIYKGTVTAEFKQKSKHKSPDWSDEKSEPIMIKFKK